MASPPASAYNDDRTLVNWIADANGQLLATCVVEVTEQTTSRSSLFRNQYAIQPAMSEIAFWASELATRAIHNGFVKMAHADLNNSPATEELAAASL